jgi:hypothetical protein
LVFIVVIGIFSISAADRHPGRRRRRLRPDLHRLLLK